VSERLTKDGVLSLQRAIQQGYACPDMIRQLCDLAVRALELDYIYGHELRPVDLRAILRKP
jgi:hypothetical protein